MDINEITNWLTREQKNIIDVKNRVTAIEIAQKETIKNLALFHTRDEFNEYRDKAREDFAFKDTTKEVEEQSLLSKLWAKFK